MISTWLTVVLSSTNSVATISSVDKVSVERVSGFESWVVIGLSGFLRLGFAQNPVSPVSELLGRSEFALILEKIRRSHILALTQACRLINLQFYLGAWQCYAPVEILKCESYDASTFFFGVCVRFKPLKNIGTNFSINACGSRCQALCAAVMRVICSSGAIKVCGKRSIKYCGRSQTGMVLAISRRLFIRRSSAPAMISMPDSKAACSIATYLSFACSTFSRCSGLFLAIWASKRFP